MIFPFNSASVTLCVLLLDLITLTTACTDVVTSSGLEYILCDVSVNQRLARAVCGSDGARLAMFPSVEEFKSVYSELSDKQWTSAVWVGARYSKDERAYVWDNGQLVEESVMSQTGSDLTPTAGHCLMLNKEYRLEATNCRTLIGFICQHIEPTTTVMTTTERQTDSTVTVAAAATGYGDGDPSGGAAPGGNVVDVGGDGVDSKPFVASTAFADKTFITMATLTVTEAASQMAADDNLYSSSKTAKGVPSAELATVAATHVDATEVPRQNVNKITAQDTTAETKSKPSSQKSSRLRSKIVKETIDETTQQMVTDAVNSFSAKVGTSQKKAAKCQPSIAADADVLEFSVDIESFDDTTDFTVVDPVLSISSPETSTKGFETVSSFTIEEIPTALSATAPIIEFEEAIVDTVSSSETIMISDTPDKVDRGQDPSSDMPPSSSQSGNLVASTTTVISPFNIPTITSPSGNSLSSTYTPPTTTTSPSTSPINAMTSTSSSGTVSTTRPTFPPISGNQVSSTTTSSQSFSFSPLTSQLDVSSNTVASTTKPQATSFAPSVTDSIISNNPISSTSSPQTDTSSSTTSEPDILDDSTSFLRGSDFTTSFSSSPQSSSSEKSLSTTPSSDPTAIPLTPSQPNFSGNSNTSTTNPNPTDASPNTAQPDIPEKPKPSSPTSSADISSPPTTPRGTSKNHTTSIPDSSTTSIPTPSSQSDTSSNSTTLRSSSGPIKTSLSSSQNITETQTSPQSSSVSQHNISGTSQTSNPSSPSTKTPTLPSSRPEAETQSTPSQTLTSSLRKSNSSDSVLQLKKRLRSSAATEQCPCLCLDPNTDKRTETDLEEEKASLQTELMVDKKTLSSRRRGLTSAVDERPSAQSMGYVGGVVLLAVAFTLVVMDVIEYVATSRYLSYNHVT
ncbi:mucin-5AC [Aplysia californica]|uniref:Mucin-5AC n=1 Tax=Aplysia californica TaxID=6500 RepID=A0ABM0JR30_APLCA|nr:mucin-5AC [Aplysia californica]